MSRKFIDDANEEVAGQRVEPLKLTEYLDVLSSSPSQAAHSSRYLLNAITAAGTRTVRERGRELTRWRFFDDPAGGGLNAVVGKTELLNQFVEDLRRVAETPSFQRAFWVNGPTGSGKSTFRRCLTNGLRAYSQTDAGRRYTIEWNVESRRGGADLTFGRASDSSLNEANWYRSPVQAQPLSVFPKAVRSTIVDELSETTGYPIEANSGLDPFSQTAWDILADYYGPSETLFERLTAPSHLRVVPYTVDIGAGIGILSAGDNSVSPRDLLVGSWSDELLRTLPYHGQKNPQAFSYDGVLSQGNRGLSIIEDAGAHAELVQRFLSVPEEQTIQIDRNLSLDVDTVLLLFSNPDLATYLESFLDTELADPLRPLRRRLYRYDLSYITDPAAENELLRREVLTDTHVWPEYTRESLDAPATYKETEITPHTFSAAALYDVITRLDGLALPEDKSYLDKGLLLDRGYTMDTDGRSIGFEAFEYDGETIDGEFGLPPTFTHEVFDTLLARETPILPHDIVQAMHDSIKTDPVFSEDEIAEYTWRARFVMPYVIGKETGDMKAGFLADLPTDDVASYLSALIEWARDDDDDGSGLMGLEETLFGFSDPVNEVNRNQFRSRVLGGVNHYIWDSRTPPESAAELDLTDRNLQLKVYKGLSWDDVLRRWPTASLTNWKTAPPNSPTGAAKAACFTGLTTHLGYSHVAAQRLIEFVLRHADNPDR